MHDCGTGRAIGYYLEPLVILSLFAKRACALSPFLTVNGAPDVNMHYARRLPPAAHDCNMLSVLCLLHTC